MGLLSIGADPKIRSLAQQIYERHFTLDPKLADVYNDQQKESMYQDILYNLDYLSIAVKLRDDFLFSDYAVWLYELLCNLMKHIDRDRMRDQMVQHYRLLIEFVPKLFEGEDLVYALTLLDKAIAATMKAVVQVKFSDPFLSGVHVNLRKAYLEALLLSETRHALHIIEEASASGIPLVEIYEDILQPTMQEVGELWHQGRITVDKEHYCTSTTQMALAQFYKEVFSQPRKNRTILTSCVGSELHEMGGRMLSDLFEYHGWDSVYLGAAVPMNALLSAVEVHHPDLVALSVTMPQHLPLCYEMVMALRSRFPAIKIAVGGRAFSMTNELWRKWPVDIYTERAKDLVVWASTEKIA